MNLKQKVLNKEIHFSDNVDYYFKKTFSQLGLK